MQEMDGPEHARLRGLVPPSSTARRAEELRPRTERTANGLPRDLARQADLDPVDLPSDQRKPAIVPPGSPSVRCRCTCTRGWRAWCTPKGRPAEACPEGSCAEGNKDGLVVSAGT